MKVKEQNSTPRIVVVGTSGSGKSTFGARAAAALGVTFIEADALNWLPGWEMRTADAARAETRQALEAATAGWVYAGNYSRTRAVVWARAQTVVWLDYSFPLVMWRILRRSVARIVTGEDLWGTGNRETLGRLFSRDSVVWWAATTYRRRRREYGAIFANPPEEYAHLSFVRLRRPGQVAAYINEVSEHVNKR